MYNFLCYLRASESKFSVSWNHSRLRGDSNPGSVHSLSATLSTTPGSPAQSEKQFVRMCIFLLRKQGRKWRCICLTIGEVWNLTWSDIFSIEWTTDECRNHRSVVEGDIYEEIVPTNVQAMR